MPEGDTLYRTADVLRRVLLNGTIVRASARAGGAQLGRLVGSRVTGIDSRGKHLLMDFDCGLTLHTHLQTKGAWHRYRPGERWRVDPHDAVAVLETRTAVAACFDAPTVELLDSRALDIHPVLAKLGPDLLARDFDASEASLRLRTGQGSSMSVAEALLDQRVTCGIGNVYRCESLFIGRIDPFRLAASLHHDDAERLFSTARDLMLANLEGGPRVTTSRSSDLQSELPWPARGSAWVYRRAGLPCRRCGSTVRATSLGRLPRRLYWCPSCQPRATHPRAMSQRT
jgi:endonuclease-8